MSIERLPHEEQQQYIDFAYGFFREVVRPCFTEIGEERPWRTKNDFVQQVISSLEPVNLSCHTLTWIGSEVLWRKVDKKQELISFCREISR